MTRYTLLSPHDTSGNCNSQDQHDEQRRTGERDLEDLEAPYKSYKPPSLTDFQRQLIGVLVFVLLLVLYVTLRFMEVTSLGYRPALLATTNILLDTPDLYHDLTLPLLKMVNRTSLITHRCGTRALAPHLLSFLDPGQLLSVQCPPPPPSLPHLPLLGEGGRAIVGNGDGQSRGGDACIAKDLIEQQKQSQNPPSSAITASQQPTPTFPSRYLFVLLVTNNVAAILPDLLTRTLEAIAILGPENCHLSIVESGTLDTSRDLLEHMAKVLRDHNARLDLPVQSSTTSVNNNGGQIQSSDMDDAQEHQKIEDSLRKIDFTLATLGVSDPVDGEDANTYWARLRTKALEPLILLDSSPEAKASGALPPKPQFDKVVFLQEALTCADDILEMVYQSQLQDADMTCGMTWVPIQHGKRQVLSLKTNQPPRDILDVPLAVPLRAMSADGETMRKFKARQPFQAACCDWRQGAVVRAEILLQQLQQQSYPPPEKGKEQVSCVIQETDLQLCSQIAQWRSSKKQHRHSDQPVVAEASSPSQYTTRIAVVPKAVWVPGGEHEYGLLESLDAEGLWSKTDQEYRDDVETRLIRASHQRTYGYHKSSAHYKYAARPAAEVAKGAARVGDEEAKSNIMQQQRQPGLPPPDRSLQVAAETYERHADSRLTRSKVAFGVRDIEQDNAIKAKKEQITVWCAPSPCPK